MTQQISGGEIGEWRWARRIPPLTVETAALLERNELERLIAMMASLPAEAWDAPLPGSQRSVRVAVAQIAGRYSALGSLSQLRRQLDPRRFRLYRKPGDAIGDTIARMRAGDRTFHSAGDLIAELQSAGPAAIRIRSSMHRTLERVQAGASRRGRPALAATPGIALRRLWLERFDLGEAAAHGFTVSADHDGAIAADLLRALAADADLALGSRSVDLWIPELDGPVVRFGHGEPIARIDLEVTSLLKLVRGRRSAAGARERSSVSGDVKTAMTLFHAMAGRYPAPS